MLILPGSVYLEKHFQDIEDDVLIGLSKKGYANDELAFAWVKHFETYSRRFMRGSHRILICDGYDSHLTAEFIEFCEEKSIHLFVLPPHTSHCLQPLDVVLFQPFKHYHGKAVNDATRTGCTNFNKVEFLAAITEIRTATFKRNSIKSAFRETGLVPFNPQKVIAKLVENRSSPSSSPSTTPPPEHFSTLTTPLTIRSLRRTAEEMDKGSSDPARGKILFEKFKKGALVQATVGDEAIQQLAETSAAATARKRRQTASNRQIKLGGVVYAYEARSMKQAREDEEAEKKRQADERRTLAMLRKLPAEQRRAYEAELEAEDFELFMRFQSIERERKNRANAKRAETRRRKQQEALQAAARAEQSSEDEDEPDEYEQLGESAVDGDNITGT